MLLLVWTTLISFGATSFANLVTLREENIQSGNV